jgi:hypothetical protein
MVGRVFQRMEGYSYAITSICPSLRAVRIIWAEKAASCGGLKTTHSSAALLEQNFSYPFRGVKRLS